VVCVRCRSPVPVPGDPIRLRFPGGETVGWEGGRSATHRIAPRPRGCCAAADDTHPSLRIAPLRSCCVNIAKLGFSSTRYSYHQLRLSIWELVRPGVITVAERRICSRFSTYPRGDATACQQSTTQQGRNLLLCENTGRYSRMHVRKPPPLSGLTCPVI
jgi:hypothetical protein